MAIAIKPLDVVIVRFSAERGRSYAHVDDGGEHCQSCDQAWSSACAESKHTKRRKLRTTIEEKAPLEAKRVQQLYTQLHSAFRGIGQHAGDNVYLVPTDADLAGVLKEQRETFASANADMTACAASFDVKVLRVDPVQASADTLASIRSDVDASIAKLVTALQTGTDPAAMRAAVRETKNLAQVVESQAASDVTACQDYLIQAAKRLRDAADEGDDAVAKAVDHARQGAARFAAIFAGEGA